MTKKKNAIGVPPRPILISRYFILFEIGDWEIEIVNKQKNLNESTARPRPNPKLALPPPDDYRVLPLSVIN